MVGAGKDSGAWELKKKWWVGNKAGLSFAPSLPFSRSVLTLANGHKKKEEREFSK